MQRLLYIYYLKYNQATKYHILRQNMNYCTLLISFQSTESFHLCQALKSEDDIASFFYSIIGILKKAAQWDQTGQVTGRVEPGSREPKPNREIDTSIKQGSRGLKPNREIDTSFTLVH